MALAIAPMNPLILQGEYTVDTLPVAGAEYVDMYARVSDLFGDKRDLVLCSQVGSTYFWQPVRQTYAKSVSGNQNMALRPLRTPSVLRLTGTLTANRTLTPEVAMAWPGAEFEIAWDGSLGIYSLTIAGLDLGATLSLLLGGRRRVIFDGAAWQGY